jgi:hypothetical protein
MAYEQEMEDNKEPISLRNEIEASLLDAILKEDGIPHFVQSYHDRAYDGLWQIKNGWGCVVSPPEYKSGIRALLAVLRREAGSIPHDDDSP